MRTAPLHVILLFWICYWLGGCQTSLFTNSLRAEIIEEAAYVSVSLPACTGVIIAADLVLTRASCLKATLERGYVALGPGPEIRSQKLIRVQEVMTVNQDWGLILLQQRVPQPFHPVAVMDPNFTLREGRRLWVTSYEAESDGQIFGQAKRATGRYVGLAGQGDILRVEIPCMADGSPLLMKHDGVWFLAGIAGQSGSCKEGSTVSEYRKVQHLGVAFLSGAALLRKKTGRTLTASSKPRVEGFQLIKEIDLRPSSYLAQIAFTAGKEQKHCEYSLHVIRYNSFFETGYDLRSQPVDAVKNSNVDLIFEDFYAGISALLGQVKQVEISSAICQSA